nr:right-handed parallel beta-helix repeat-containing protein [uncultured Muribaculum sp.]
MINRFLNIFLIIVLLAVASGCIEDGFTDDSSARPEFSVDTLNLGLAFSGEITSVHSFRVYNRHDRNLLISRIALRDGNEAYRLNVDGVAGKEFADVAIRPHDSIYVFVDAQFPPVGHDGKLTVKSLLDFEVNGGRSTVVLSAECIDVTVVPASVLSADALWSGAYHVMGDVTVASGVTLNLAEGTTLYFHDKASLNVEGAVVADGTPEKPVVMCGDRNGTMVGRIPYDIVPGQWSGVTFAGTGSRLSHTVVRNTSSGIAVTGGEISMLNCVVRNSRESVISVTDAEVKAVGCEFADAPGGVVTLDGRARLTMNHCTVANSYLFAPVTGALLELKDDGVSCHITNSIIYGNGQIGRAHV